MGFVRSMEEIMAGVGREAEFYGAEMLNVLWLTRPEIVAALLPKPLEPVDLPLAAAFVADYPKTNFSLPYKEAALFLMARFKEEIGAYCLAMPVDNDMAMAGGREVFGYPKKMARVHFKKDNDRVEGWAERHGVRFFEVKAHLNGTPNDPPLAALVNPGPVGEKEIEHVAFNFKYFPSPEGQGFDYNPRLIRETVSSRPDIETIGEAEIILRPSNHDPWVEVVVEKVIGAAYTKGNNTMKPGRVAAEVDPTVFLPHAFLRWDAAPK